jgi:hypothetical protein
MVSPEWRAEQEDSRRGLHRTSEFTQNHKTADRTAVTIDWFIAGRKAALHHF